MDNVGDIYLVGRMAAASVSADEIDRVLGQVLEAVDSDFNTLLELGFRSSIQKEWEWRVSRGESLKNLAGLRAPHRRGGEEAQPDRRDDSCGRDARTWRLWYCSATARASGTRRTCSPAGSTSTSPPRAGPRPRAAASCSPSRACCPTCVHTSLLRRAIRTANLALDAADRLWIPVAARLAAQRAPLRRAAGQGQGRRPATEFGDEQFMLWRRSYDTPPPPIADEATSSARSATRATPTSAGTAPADRVPERRGRRAVLPYWGTTRSCRDLQAGQDRPRGRARQLAARPGQAPRRDLSDADIVGLNIPTGIPLLYELDADLRRRSARRRYLDPEAAAAAAAAVANQGANK